MYQKKAYITLQSSLQPEQLLKECQSFCRMCGAEQIFATGDPCLENLPLYTAMWQMRCNKSSLPDTDAALWPVQQNTVGLWKDHYNRKTAALPNGAWMTDADGQRMLEKGDGYFIHRGGSLLGIGRASGETLDFVASLAPGAGGDAVCALSHAMTGETVELTVASVNEKAVRLYERLGFLKTRELSRWYWVSGL